MNKSEKKKCIILGAGGFIGGQLSKRLIEQGHTVYGVDIKKHEFLDLSFEKFTVGDLRNINVVRDVIPEDIDELYQLAADMGGMTYIGNKLNDASIMTNSVLINLNVLQVAVEKKVKKIFYSSSACIYPEYNQLDPENPKCSEDSAYPAAPDSEYGWEKLYSERLYKAYELQYGLNIRIARFHNVYGPYGTYEGGKEKAPAAICRKTVLGTDIIEVIGDGEQTRSFLYINDCLDAVQLLMDSEYKNPINIGSEEMVTINQLVTAVGEIADKKLVIKYIPGPQGVRGRNSDNNLIRKILNWEPKYTLKDGLTSTYEWISSKVKV